MRALAPYIPFWSSMGISYMGDASVIKFVFALYLYLNYTKYALYTKVYQELRYSAWNKEARLYYMSR